MTCVGGGERALVATVAVKGVLAGTLGGVPLRAELKRDPPAPGALRPRPPPSIAGKYKLAPRSDCLGGALELEKAGGSAYEIKGGIGRLVVHGAGPIAGRVTCRDKSVRAVTGQAVNRDLTLNVPGRRHRHGAREGGRDQAARLHRAGGRLLPRRRRGHALRAAHGRARSRTSASRA